MFQNPILELEADTARGQLLSQSLASVCFLLNFKIFLNENNT